jgi:hypothetical protein
MAAQTFTIKNNSTDTSAVINRFTFADQSGIDHNVDFTGWNVPWGSGGYATLDDTLQQTTKTYIDDVSPENAVYQSSYTFPTTDTLRSADWMGTSLGILVGDNGTILSTPNGGSWTIENSGVSAQLNDVHWNGSRFVVVGNGGTILTSPDGVVWTSQTSGTTSNLIGISSDGTNYLAVGVSGIILSSTNGSSWNSETSGVAVQLNDVVWDGAQYVVVGASGTILTSPDGSTWTSQTSGTSNTLNDIAWDGVRFVAVGNSGTILTSTDGISWTLRTSGTTENLHASTNDGVFIVSGNNGTILTSSNGSSWTSRNSNLNKDLYALTGNGTIILALGESGAVIFSNDSGTSWGNAVTNYLIVDNTTDIQTGFILSGNGYSDFQEVVNVNSSTWLTISNFADGISVPGSAITFTPSGGIPYALQVSGDTSGLDVGWVASGNGYSGQTILAFSGTNWLSMSGPPNTTPTLGGSITFSESNANMWTIAPLDTKTFALDYTNSTSVTGQYTSVINIYADIGGPTIKTVRGVVDIAPAPPPPSSPYYEGGSSSGSYNFYYNTSPEFYAGISFDQQNNINQSTETQFGFSQYNQFA